MKTILTLTMNPALDINTAIANVVPERKLRCDTPRYEPGGGGINVSRALHNLGGTSVAAYVTGGPTGLILEHLLAHQSFEHHPLRVAGWTRPSFVVFETTTSLQYRFGTPGPTLDPMEADACLKELTTMISKSDFLVASGSLPPGAPEDCYAQVARIGKQAGSRIILDTSGSALRLALEQGVCLCKPNLNELRNLVGSDLLEEREQEDAARSIVEQGKSEVVVVSLGGAGALLATRAGVTRMRAPTVKIQSKVGAGDSMVAGITLGLSRDMPLIEAVRFGLAAGSAAVMTPGTELCRRDDTERLYRQMTS